MKKLKFSFLTLFILTTLAANAQISFGVKAGLNLSNMNMSGGLLNLNMEVKPGFNAGIFAEYMFNEKMGIQPAFSFSTIGARTKMPNYKVAINFNTLQVPIHFAYKIAIDPNFKITLHAGPYAAYMLSGKIKFPSSTNENNINLYKDNSLIDWNLKRIDAGLGFGIALGYGNFLIDLGYDLGLVNMIKKTALIKSASIKTKNIYLSLGYKF